VQYQELREIRDLFGVTEHWVYLYNGSIHPCPRPVSEAIRGFLKEWENGGEAAFFGAYECFDRLRERFAALIGADARNIVVTESTTAGINLAAQILRPARESNVVVTDLAFMSNTYLWLASSSAVQDVRFVESRDGRVDIADIGAAIDQRTALVHLCAVTVGSGYRYDLRAVAEVARERRVPLVVDAAQALGLIEVDVRAFDPDFMATTMSKWLMGPTGVGLLYVADKHLEATPPVVGWLSAANVGAWDVRHCELHDDARRFQGGIPNLPGVVGAEAALKLVEQIGRERIEAHVRDLTTYLLTELQGMEKHGLQLWTPEAWDERAGIVFFRVPAYEELHAQLRERKVYCGTFQGGIRLDPGVYNTIEEIDTFVAIVREHCESLA